MRVVIASDHGGFELKKELREFLEGKDYNVDDLGPQKFDADDDYPDFGKKVAERVSKEGSKIGQENILGILICRSAGGIIITANKFKGVRAVAAYDETQAKHARQHNDANILGLSGDWTSEKEANKIVIAYLETPYSDEERHTRRLNKILKMER